MATRIYQGKIVSAQFENPEDKGIAKEAIRETNRLFQDAVNYHIVALAGMARKQGADIGAQFRVRIESIWMEKSVERTGAKSLQESVTRSLNLPGNYSFDEVVQEIYRGCERIDILPYVLQYIVYRTAKGEGVIQQEGRGLLPKLCDSGFSGNFEYSTKERKAVAGNELLVRELGREDICDEKLRNLAAKMDLSWAGVKTQPDATHEMSLLYNQEEVRGLVDEAMRDMCATLKAKGDAAWNKYAESSGVKNLHDEVVRILQLPSAEHALAKNNKAVAELKQAAIFFMFYPCRHSAKMLYAKLKKQKTAASDSGDNLDFSQLENDPILMCRGQRKYIYPGFSALSNWETQDAEMYSNEWDILAFKEALKALHGFELKTRERDEECRKLQAQIEYVTEGKKTKGVLVDGEDEESVVAVLGGDKRFELLQRLVKLLSPVEVMEDAEDSGRWSPVNLNGYYISTRTLSDYEKIREKWMEREAAGTCSSQDLVQIVRDCQSQSKKFGSQLLFEALCQDEYRSIWHDYVGKETAGLPRSKNILRDFSRLQTLVEKWGQYKRPVRVSAADAVYSPRQLMYSDLSSFGPEKGCELLSGCKGGMRMQVIVRNGKGRLETAPVIVRFSAPRFERDELTADAGNWIVAKKGSNESLPWLQPMMKALGCEVAPVQLTRTPAIALQVKGDDLYLNFPVSLNVNELQEHIGKAVRWKSQFLGGKDEKLHLHWGATYKGKEIPWWEQASVKAEGFQVLGVDLGIRSAAAWSLVHIGTESAMMKSDNRQVSGRVVGDSGNARWYGYILKQGLSRLPGEAPRKVGSSCVKPISLPTDEDIRLARIVLQDEEKEIRAKDVLILGNKVLTRFRRLISRLKTYLSFLAGLNDLERREASMGRMKEYFGYSETIPGIMAMLEEQNVEGAYDEVYTATLSLVGKMPGMAEAVTSLILPRKRGCWKWVPESHKGWQGSGRMTLLEEARGNTKRHIYHRGGLSVARLSQLEMLRQLLQSMSKVLSFEPGKPVSFGRDLKNMKVIDPCPQILSKIENMREQRVNMIAHDIVAQALGVRLIPSRDGKNPDGRDIIHGEYEVIPGRKPVDFVVLENLSRYLTSLDRSAEENSTLMRWAHRQIAAKVKQLLEEVFGIPVIFTHAHHTSRFDSVTSAPGCRPTLLNIDQLRWMQTHGKDDEKKIADSYLAVWKDVEERGKQGKVTLLRPHHANGGEYLLSENQGKFSLRNADMNAATNIVWRGVAAPESLHLLHRVRLEFKKSGITPLYGNEREKSVKSTWRMELHDSVKLDDSTGTRLSAFAVGSDWADKAFASYGGGENFYPLCHGKVLWGIMKKQQWSMCHRYNIQQLQHAGIDARLLEQFLNVGAADCADDIPL